MKPNFALNLSHDGIGLLHRGKSGWELVGEVALDAPDFGERLTALRRAAKTRAPEGVTTKIVVPASQILYAEITAPGPQSAVRRRQIADALEGMTPYAVPDLVFDWSGEGEVVQVAVVARETLAEAEAFADDCGFFPVSFVAAPDPAQFAGEPWFGITTTAPAHLPQGARIERDTEALPPDLLRAAAASVVEPGTETVAEPGAEPGAEPLAAQPELAPPAPEPAAAASAPEPAPEPEAATAAATAPIPAEPAPEPAPEPTPGPAAEAQPTPQPDPIPEPAAAPVEPPAPEPTPEVAASVAPPAAEAPVAAPQPAAAQKAAATTPPAAAKTPPKPPAPKAEAPSAPPADLLAALDETPLSGIDTVAPLQIAMPEPVAKTPRPADAARAGAAPRKPLPGAARPGTVGEGLDSPKPAPRKPLLAETDRPAPALGETEAAATDAPGTAEALRKIAEDGRRLAALGAAALETTASKALAKARALRPAPDATDSKPAAATPAAESAPARTVFGTRKTPRIGGKPKYMGPALLGGLIAFLAIAALWSSFLIKPEAPTETIAPAAPEAAAPAMPPQDATPEPAPPAAPPVTPVAPAPETGAPATPAPEAGAPVALPALPPLPPLTTPPAATTTTPPAPPPVPGAPAAAQATPSRDGTLTAEGFTLFAGTPPSKSKPRPASVSRAAEAAAAEAAAAAAAPPADPALKNARPKPRPASVAAAAEKAAQTPPPAAAPEAPAASPDDGALLAPGLSPDLARVLRRAQPKERPDSVARTAAAARAEEAAAEAALAAEAAAAEAGLASSRRPMTRPRNFEAAVQSALAAAIAAEPPPPVQIAAIAPEPLPVAPQKPVRAKPSPPPEPTLIPGPDVETGEVESATVIPRGPTAASVAREATQKNALDLSRISLIGLYGTPSNRRALVRMPNGRFFKLQVGDRIDGGRVIAIGESQMTYQKGNRPITLSLLKGG